MVVKCDPCILREELRHKAWVISQVDGMSKSMFVTSGVRVDIQVSNTAKFIQGQVTPLQQNRYIHCRDRILKLYSINKHRYCTDRILYRAILYLN